MQPTRYSPGLKLHWHLWHRPNGILWELTEVPGTVESGTSTVRCKLFWRSYLGEYIMGGRVSDIMCEHPIAHTSRLKTSNQYWLHVGSASTTLAQRETNIDSTSCVCWEVSSEAARSNHSLCLTFITQTTFTTCYLYHYHLRLSHASYHAQIR